MGMPVHNFMVVIRMVEQMNINYCLMESSRHSVWHTEGAQEIVAKLYIQVLPQQHAPHITIYFEDFKTQT